MNVRCFIGIDLPHELADALVSAGRALAQADGSWAGEKWVPASNLHVTSCFIGSVDPGRMRELVEVLGSTVRSCAPFDLKPEQVVAVPRSARARMIWATFRDDSALAADLARAVSQQAVRYGHAPERRAYSAHVTLCRARTPRPVGTRALEAANTLLPPTLPCMSVSSATLFASRLTPRGPEYERLAVWHLGGA